MANVRSAIKRGRKTPGRVLFCNDRHWHPCRWDEYRLPRLRIEEQTSIRKIGHVFSIVVAIEAMQWSRLRIEDRVHAGQVFGNFRDGRDVEPALAHAISPHSRWSVFHRFFLRKPTAYRTRLAGGRLPLRFPASNENATRFQPFRNRRERRLGENLSTRVHQHLVIFEQTPLHHVFVDQVVVETLTPLGTELPLPFRRRAHVEDHLRRRIQHTDIHQRSFLRPQDAFVISDDIGTAMIVLEVVEDEIRARTGIFEVLA